MQLRLNLNTILFAITTLLVGTGCRSVEATTGNVMVQTHRAIAHPVANRQAAGNEQILDETRCGVLVMAHGGDESWNRAVEQVVSPLRESYPIEIAFGMAKTSTIRTAVERLENQGVEQIAVVRMFISGDSFLDNTEYILGLRDDLADETHHDTRLAPGPMRSSDPSGMATHTAVEAVKQMGHGHMMEAPKPIKSDATFFLSEKGVVESPLIDDILVDRVESLSLDPSTESILIVAHGPGDDEENERWLADMRRRVERLRAIGPFIDIQCETLREDWPNRRVEAEHRIRTFVKSHGGLGRRVIVIPFRVAGFGPYGDVLEGLDYVADGRGFCPHPNMTLWIDQTARTSLPSLPKVHLGARPIRDE